MSGRDSSVLRERQQGAAKPVFISVVVPAYNEEKRLAGCINALLNLEYPSEEYEIIVVNSNSSDRTAEIAAGHSVSYIHEKNPGVSRARNAGIRAAKGDIVAFVDADCVPETGWLKELLRGIDNPDIGCFAGEFAPLRPFSSLIAEYVHDRKLIHQGTLLGFSPSVAAAGNVAYRKEVFETAGAFDETLYAGEDTDLSFRLQKNGGYRIQYNPSAVVYHAHPENMAHLLKRAFRIGKAISAVRRKHAEDFPAKMFSRRHLLYGLMKTIAGSAGIPYRIASGLRHGTPGGKSFFYPFLDKAHAISQSLGTLVGQMVNRTPCSQTAIPPGADIQVKQAENWMDLNTTSFFIQPQSPFQETTRCEIKAISRILTKHLKDVTVLLTGSFSVGEGRSDGSSILSDYDMVAITPHWMDTLPVLVGKRLQADMDRIRLSADLDIALIWKPFLKFGITTTAGRIISGVPRLETTLVALKPPMAVKAGLSAYRFLAQAPLDASRYSMWVSKAIVRSAQAFLLNCSVNYSRSDRVSLSSIRFIEQTIVRSADIIGKDAIGLIQKSCRELLGRNCGTWTREEYPEACALLNRFGANLLPPGRWQDFTKHALWLRRMNLSGFPTVRSEKDAFLCLQQLCGTWGPEQGPDIDKLVKASGVAERLCRHSINHAASDPLETYRNLMGLVASYIDYYPHKLRWSRNGEIRS